MDPVDREKPWSVLGQLAVIACAIGLIYLVIRLAVVVPEWGWQIVLALAVGAPFLYHFLAFRSGLGRKPGAPRFTAGQRRLQRLTALLLFLALCVPAWVAVYWFRSGTLPWQ